MKRQITGLHAADRCAADQIPDGLFLVRVQRVKFHRQAQKPYYTLTLAVLEPSRFAERAEQYWRLEKLKSFDEFLERRFPGSRRKAYYLMSIHEHLPPQARKQLKEVGWAKGLELAKVARRDRQHFDCATWLHKARQMPKEDFKREVERELTGKETEPWEVVYFKLYQSQMPVIERAIETAYLMLGSDRSRGYCLEMICADFLAGANLDNGDPEMLLFSMTRFFKFLPGEQRQAFLEGLSEKAS